MLEQKSLIKPVFFRYWFIFYVFLHIVITGCLILIHYITGIPPKEIFEEPITLAFTVNKNSIVEYYYYPKEFPLVRQFVYSPNYDFFYDYSIDYSDWETINPENDPEIVDGICLTILLCLFIYVTIYPV